MRPSELASLINPRPPELNAVRRRLAACYSVDDLRAAARRRLPRSIFDYVDGGSEDEVTLRRNRTAFEALPLVPRVMTDVSRVDLSTTVLSRPWRLPLGLSPSGFTRLVHPEGELAVARAAAKAHVTYAAAMMANASLEEIAATAAGPRWFQLYIWRDRGLGREIVARARAAGYEALVVTVDVPISATRERDLRSGITMPPTIKLRTIADGLRHPQWWWKLITNEKLTFGNFVDVKPAESLMAFVSRQFDAAVRWEDVAWLKELWGGPIVLKGTLSPEDAVLAADAGADAIVVSNHGGRQLNQAPATIEALPAIVDAAGDRLEVLLDSGVRRGGDIVRALSLGAKACLVGRPYLYGLGAGGEAGVTRMLELLEDELNRVMMLVGAPSVADLHRGLIAV
jgi:L-lactate dehydrogenase (cytochrome)